MASTVFHSPPESNKESIKPDESDSELSDVDAGVTVEAVEPDDIENGVPIFRPNMEQFADFTEYMKKINKWGMQSGIVKVVPPPKWRKVLPDLDEAIKAIRVKEPIKQDIMGTSGTYRQANILHQRSYNLPQWRQLCEQSDHQPPAKRGERRANNEKVARPTPKPKTTTTTTSTPGVKRGRGRPPKDKPKAATTGVESIQSTPDRLPTPVSPNVEEDSTPVKLEAEDEDVTPSKGKGGRQPKAISVSSRRKYNRREAAAKVDETAFEGFNYRLEGNEYTPERCEELERLYWKTLTYAPPLYGADMPGTLFDERTTAWNLGKLDNILDIMGSQIPGVNTAYLYLGMWKATFAWHLEDVDLYSINYLHFGAPKQWYSISQKDARRFEAAMKTVWPTDAKACDQFLRHKTFLISPSTLWSNFNIKVNKTVSHPGEFVITFPYGYHSGYNLGYNCAEAVNFGLESWLEYGRVAKKCDCSQAQDSVWIDVHELERKLRGEETDYEITDDEEDEDDEQAPADLPTPPESSGDVKTKAPRRKRKRDARDKDDKSNVKRIRMRIKAPAKEPCILCPNDIPSEPLLPTEDGKKAHRMCALYIPEVVIDSGDMEMVTDLKYVDKARLELKCNYCRSKKGACFQCSQKKCTRAYHPTCAAAAGVFAEQGEMPVFGEDGTEYKEWAIEFSCRFHRTKRDKKIEGDVLEEDERIRTGASELKVGETCQMQYYNGGIFAGVIVQNRKSEEMIMVDILPTGDRVEVEYKWILVPDPADYHIPKPSANAIPMPKSRKDKDSLNTTKRLAGDQPRADDPFVTGCTWAEFHTAKMPINPDQVKVDFSKENQIWYYLGKTSSEAKAQFTEDVRKPRHNPKGHFLDTLPKPITKHAAYSASYPRSNQQALDATKISRSQTNLPQTNRAQSIASATKSEKPYVYKPRSSGDLYHVDPQAYRSQQTFLHHSAPYSFGTDPRWQQSETQSPHNVSHTPAARTPQAHQKMLPPAKQPGPSIPPTPPMRQQASMQQSPSVPKPSNPFGNRMQSSKPNTFAKYKYLQIEHNRSPLDYKSPYRPGFGFMNGYQGSEENFRKHAQQTYIDKRPYSSNSPSTSLMSSSSGHRPSSSSHPPPSPAYSSVAPSTYGGYYGGSTQPKPLSQSEPLHHQNSWNRTENSQMHPAIRREFSPMYHQQYQPSQPMQSIPLRKPSWNDYGMQSPAQKVQYQQSQPRQHMAYDHSASYSTQSRNTRPAEHQFQPTQRYSHPSTSQPQYNYSMTQNPTAQSPVHQQHRQSVGQQSTQMSTSHHAYQPPHPAYQQENRPVYPHQQYFQKMQAPVSQAPSHVPQSHNQKPQAHDLPDVPVDSTSLIENMMANLRKAAGSASS